MKRQGLIYGLQGSAHHSAMRSVISVKRYMLLSKKALSSPLKQQNLHSSSGSDLREKVKDFITKNQSLAPTDMKTLFGVSRKYAIPYLEYLDRIHFTVRVDNVRKLGSPQKG